MSEMMGLPISDTESIANMNEENTTIDMSKLEFPVDKDKQNNAALIYIRNMNICAKFCFDSCDYETKAWFMLTYLKRTSLDVNIKPLSETWLIVLSHGYLSIPISEYTCIFDDSELEKFCNDNKEYIFELRRFLVSIPLVSMDFFRTELINKNEKSIDLDDLDVSAYPRSSFDMINISSFINIITYPVAITIQQEISDIEPIWYSSYFDQKRSNFYGYLINLFPYLDILNMFLPDNQMIRDIFINELNKTLDGTNSEVKES